MHQEKKLCDNCKADFLLRRSDQKFCSNKCRSRYHNKNNLKNHGIVKEVNISLFKDYKILLSLIGDKKEVEVSKYLLGLKGFSFKFQTILENWKDLNKDFYPGLYDLCYHKVEGTVNYKITRI